MGRFRSHRWILTLAWLPLLGGCTIPLDLVNPALIGAFGGDPYAVYPPQGRVIISFNNTSNAVAAFFAAYSDSTTDPTTNAKGVFAENVVPDEVRNRVIDCEVGIISIGTPGDGAAAVLVDTGAGELLEIPYAGASLVPGRDFNCGDVIEVSLIQIGAGADAASFSLQVRIFPGQ